MAWQPIKKPSSRPGRRQLTAMSDINITPFVDVMLVLLIIFMVTAPFLTSGVELDLPETSATPLPGTDEPLVISVLKDGRVFLENNAINLDELAPKLAAIVGEKKDTRIFVRGDASVDYGRVMVVVSEVYRAGFSKVAFVTENPENK